MTVATDMEVTVMQLIERVRQLEEIVSIVVPEFGGQEETYHKAIDMDGFRGHLSQVLVHGKLARLEAQKVDKACLRVGESSLHCMDEVGETGPLGVGKGVIGRFLSQVDSLPAGQTTEV